MSIGLWRFHCVGKKLKYLLALWDTLLYCHDFLANTLSAIRSAMHLNGVSTGIFIRSRTTNIEVQQNMVEITEVVNHYIIKMKKL